MYAGSFKHTTIISLCLCKVTADQHTHTYTQIGRNTFKCIIKVLKVLLRNLEIVSRMEIFFINRIVSVAFLSPLWAHMKDLQM